MGYPTCFGSLELASISPNGTTLYQISPSHALPSRAWREHQYDVYTVSLHHFHRIQVCKALRSHQGACTRRSNKLRNSIRPRYRIIVAAPPYGPRASMPWRGVKVMITPPLVATVVEYRSESHRVATSIDAYASVMTSRSRFDHCGEYLWR